MNWSIFNFRPKKTKEISNRHPHSLDYFSLPVNRLNCENNELRFLWVRRSPFIEWVGRKSFENAKKNALFFLDNWQSCLVSETESRFPLVHPAIFFWTRRRNDCAVWVSPGFQSIIRCTFFFSYEPWHSLRPQNRSGRRRRRRSRRRNKRRKRNPSGEIQVTPKRENGRNVLMSSEMAYWRGNGRKTVDSSAPVAIKSSKLKARRLAEEVADIFFCCCFSYEDDKSQREKEWTEINNRGNGRFRADRNGKGHDRNRVICRRCSCLFRSLVAGDEFDLLKWCEICRKISYSLAKLNREKCGSWMETNMASH